MGNLALNTGNIQNSRYSKKFDTQVRKPSVESNCGGNESSWGQKKNSWDKEKKMAALNKYIDKYIETIWDKETVGEKKGAGDRRTVGAKKTPGIRESLEYLHGNS